MKIKLTYVMLGLSPFVVYACSANKHSTMKNYPTLYQQAVTTTSSTEQTLPNDQMVAAVGRFTEAFAALTSPELNSRVDKIYAEELYFNDTFKTIFDKTELIKYLDETAQKLISSDIWFEAPLITHNDAYIRWTMKISFKAGGKCIESDSIGITHLRFNNDAQVIIHQDYWDSAYGFYQHLPLVGGLVRWVQNKL